MDDDTLVEFIQHFDALPLSNDDFEFPDLLGAVYEYLIKYFADSVGKKGGEFYTPSEVVRMVVGLIEPHEGMGLEPTTHCWAPDFESDATCEKTRGKTPVSDSCQQIASSGDENDADLATVIAAWTELPDVVKAGILAMVNCASGDLPRDQS